MRIIGFSKKWPKLGKPLAETFTTFRFPWSNGFQFQVGDRVQVVFKPRSPKREILGIAEILSKEFKADCSKISDAEAIADGFESSEEFEYWLLSLYGDRVFRPIIKYTLFWIERVAPCPK